MKQQTLAERANVAYATVGRGKRVHYSPRNDETLCVRFIGRYIDVEQAAELFDNGYEMCLPCVRAAEKRAEAHLAAEAEQAAAEAQPAVHHFNNTCEAYDATQCRDDIHDGDVLVIEREQVVGFLRRAWPGAITAAHGELHTFTADPRTIDDGKYAASAERAEQIARELGAPLAGRQRVIEGVVVEHAGTAEGSIPSDATHPNVVAARRALTGLQPATMTDHHDVNEPTEAEHNVRGYLIDPREGRRVAVYWLEGGRIMRRDDKWHGPSLDCLADRLRRSGWAVEKMLRSSQCVFAHRPADDVKPAPTAVESAVVATPTAAEKNTRAANEALAGVDFGEPRCLHKVLPIKGVSGDPITVCARKQPNQEAGVFNDEGCIEAYDCAVQAANEAARLNTEEDAAAGDPLYGWDLMCPEHREQQVDTCEECNAVPAEDRCEECQGKGCHWCHSTGEQQNEQNEAEAAEQDVAETELAETVEAVEQAEAADGTWRGGWIASAPPATGDALFGIGEGEQGALFD